MRRGGSFGASGCYDFTPRESEEAMLLSQKFVRAFVIGMIALGLAILVARLCGCNFPPTPPEPDSF